MPFVTEELWQTLRPHDASEHDVPRSIMVAPYPVCDDRRTDADAERAVNAAIDEVRALRNARAERKIEASVWMEARIYAGSILEQMKTLAPLIERLSRTRIISVQDRESRLDAGDSQETIILADTEIVLAGVNAAEAERIRQLLLKEAESTRARLEGVEQRLADDVFLSRAPADVVARQRELAASLQDRLARLGTELGQLG